MAGVKKSGLPDLTPFLGHVKLLFSKYKGLFAEVIIGQKNKIKNAN